jgi:choline dehydrogenase-like flavoprotein
MTRNHAGLNHYERVRAARPNYHLLPSNIVGKVLFEGKKAVGVCYLSTRATSSDCSTKAYASKEIILTAGGFGTPKILQLSGIGPKKLLQKFSVPVVADLPGVGQNLQDQPTLAIPYTCELTHIPTTIARGEL